MAAGTIDIKPYLDRAKQESHAAEINIREALYAVAISRSYYAMFYAASGLLAGIGIAHSKHSGVISAFRQHFIKSGLIEAVNMATTWELILTLPRRATTNCLSGLRLI